MKPKTIWNLHNAIVVIQTLASIPLGKNASQEEQLKHLQQIQEVLRLSGIKSHLYSAGFVPHRPEFYFLDCAGEIWNDWGKDAINIFKNQAKFNSKHPLSIKKIIQPEIINLNPEYEWYIQEKIQQTPLVSFYKKNLLIKIQPFLFQIPQDLNKYIKEIKKNIPNEYSIVKPNKINTVDKEYFELRLNRIQRLIEEQRLSPMRAIVQDKLRRVQNYIPILLNNDNNNFSFIINSSRINPDKEFRFKIKADSIDDEKKLIELLNFDLLFRHIKIEKPVFIFQKHQFVFLEAQKQQKIIFTPIDRNHPNYFKNPDQLIILEAFHQIKDQLDIQQQLQTKNISSTPKVRF